MKTLKEPFDNLLAIEVPIDAFSIQDTHADGIMWRMPSGDYDSFYFEVEPRFDYKIIGIITHTEIGFDVKPYIEFESLGDDDGKIYKDYLNVWWGYSKPSSSFRSLLSYNGIEIKEGYKLVILEKQ